MTRRSITAALATVALLAATGLSSPLPAEANHALPGRPIRWLAAGDSYSAGFGLPGVHLFSGCTHSEQAWPALAKERIETSGFEVKEFRQVACSGDKIPQMIAGQLDANGRNWDLVTLNMGGNDAGFPAVLATCIGASLLDPTDRFSWIKDPVTGCPPDGLVRAEIDKVGRRYPAFLDTVASHMRPGGNVIVVGYPSIFETYDRWNLTAKATGLCHGVDRAGVERIRGWGGRLNQVIGAAVQEADRRKPNGVSFSFVNVNDGAGNNPGHSKAPVQESSDLFEAVGSPDRHNLCGSDSWMFALAPNNLGLFHPTEQGHLAESRLVAITLSNLTWTAQPDMDRYDQVAQEFIRRAINGEDVRDLVLKVRYVDPDGSTVPDDHQEVIDAARTLRRHAAPNRAIVAGDYPEDSEADESLGEGCGYEGDLHVGCRVLYMGTSGAAVDFHVSLTAYESMIGVDGFSTWEEFVNPGSMDSDPARFQLPSGNIGCHIDDAEARCDIREKTWKAPPLPTSCYLDWGDAIVVTDDGAGFSCHGDTVLDAPKTLPYGSTVSRGDFQCQISETGVTCRHLPSGAGFQLSRTSYRIF